MPNFSPLVVLRPLNPTANTIIPFSVSFTTSSPAYTAQGGFGLLGWGLQMSTLNITSGQSTTTGTGGSANTGSIG